MHVQLTNDQIPSNILADGGGPIGMETAPHRHLVDVPVCVDKNARAVQDIWL